MPESPESAELLVEQAHLSIIRHDPPRARALLEQAIALDPNNKDAAQLLHGLPVTQTNAVPPMQTNVMPPTPANDVGYNDFVAAKDQADYQYAAQISAQAGLDEEARLANLQRDPLSPFAPGLTGRLAGESDYDYMRRMEYESRLQQTAQGTPWSQTGYVSPFSRYGNGSLGTGIGLARMVGYAVLGTLAVRYMPLAGHHYYNSYNAGAIMPNNWLVSVIGGSILGVVFSFLPSRSYGSYGSSSWWWWW